MPRANDETLQFFSLLLGILLPDLQTIYLTPVTIKPSVDLFKIPSHYLSP